MCDSNGIEFEAFHVTAERQRSQPVAAIVHGCAGHWQLGRILLFIPLAITVVPLATIFATLPNGMSQS